jgi:hypothetical protein
MDVREIVKELRRKAESLREAADVLESTFARKGTATVAEKITKRKYTRRRRKMSAAARAKMSAGMKRFWAKRHAKNQMAKSA